MVFFYLGGNMLKNYFDEDKYTEIKDSDNQIYKALEIVTTLFENDLDKGGMPYLLHLMYVYKHVSTEDEKTVALLHDVIEDKDVSKEDLLAIGFNEKVVDDVVMLTRVKPIEYSMYIDNMIKNGSVEALHVKLADLENNMDITRIANPTLKDIERVKKRYIPTHEKIMNRLEEIENDRHKANKR
jgi:(p)ppGpp synthase/HD superfamily hydrolase